MRTHSIAVALSVCAVMLLVTAAPAQRKKTTHTRTTVKKKVAFSGAETGLAGIKLFDSGTRVVAVYGTPDDVQAVTLGGGGAGPGGGAAGGAGGANLPGGGGIKGGGGVKGGGGQAGAAAYTFPGDFDFDGAVPDRQRGGPGLSAPSGPPGQGGGGPQVGGSGGGPQVGGAGGGGAAGPGGGGMGGGSSDRVIYTRWIYNRGGAKYGFILDKFNHVIQCEAIGISAGKARTRRGITFGSNFAQIIKAYGAPDGYEFAGDNLVVRYLSKSKCAFRMSKLGEDKPSVVTGIVVAAGKR